jgi:hypothetical protein
VRRRFEAKQEAAAIRTSATLSERAIIQSYISIVEGVDTVEQWLGMLSPASTEELDAITSGRTVDASIWKALVKIALVYFECVLDLVRAYLHGTALKEKAEEIQQRKSQRKEQRRVAQRNSAHPGDVSVQQQDRFRNFFRPTRETDGQGKTVTATAEQEDDVQAIYDKKSRVHRRTKTTELKSKSKKEVEEDRKLATSMNGFLRRNEATVTSNAVTSSTSVQQVALDGAVIRRQVAMGTSQVLEQPKSVVSDRGDDSVIEAQQFDLPTYWMEPPGWSSYPSVPEVQHDEVVAQPTDVVESMDSGRRSVRNQMRLLE